VQNIEGVHLALWSQLGTRLKGAFKEGVHLWGVHLGGFLCKYNTTGWNLGWKKAKPGVTQKK